MGKPTLAIKLGVENTHDKKQTLANQIQITIPEGINLWKQTKAPNQESQDLCQALNTTYL